MQFNPNVPVHLDRIIYKVMDKVPANRYRTADQLGRILISYQKQGQDVTANVPPSVQPSSQPSGQPTVQSPQHAPLQGPQLQRPNVYPAPTQPQNQPQNQPLRAPYVAPQQQQHTPLSNAYIQQQPQRPNSAPANQPVRPATGPYVAPPAQHSGYPSESGSSRPVMPEYNLTPAPPAIDVVSIILAVIAFLAVIGLFPLWLAVLNTWFSAGH
jgi:hypothetical protein